MKTNKKTYIAILALCLILPLFLSCSATNKDDDSKSASVTLNFGSLRSSSQYLANGDFSATATSADVATITVTASGDGFDDISETVTVTDSANVSITIEVPKGNARTFTVEAMNADGAVIFGGETTTDLEGDDVTISISMLNAVEITSSLITSTSWKASSTETFGWETYDFDDSGLSYAEEQVSCENTNLYRNLLAMGYSAQPIWTSGGTDNDAFLRKKFYLPDLPQAATIDIYAANDFELYVNGSLVDSKIDGIADTYASSYDVSALLNDGANVITIHGQNNNASGCKSVFAEMTFSSTLPPNPMIGTWGVTAISHTTSGQWTTEFTKATFDSDGTGTISTTSNENNIQSSDAFDITYTSTQNADGSYDLVIMSDYFTDTITAAFSDDKSTVIFDGTDDTNEVSLMVGVKMSDKTYDIADLAGDFYLIGYSTLGSPSSSNSSKSGLFNFKKSSSYTSFITVNNNGSVFSAAPYGKYLVAQDGTVVTGLTGNCYLSYNNDMMVYSNPTAMNNWETSLLMKMEDGAAYSTSDLQGTWAFMGLGDSSGISYVARFGTMTCGTAGDCTMTYKDLTDGTLTAVVDAPTPVFGVSSDGSFGTSLSATASTPDYAAAIGRGGNVIVLNTSLDSSAPSNERNLMIGVRCTNCTDFTTGIP